MSVRRRTIKVELTKDELLVCLRGLTSIHEWDPKREIAREAFTKLIRAAQQSSDASPQPAVTAELMGTIIPYLAPMVSIDEVREKLTSVLTPLAECAKPLNEVA